MPRSAGKGLLPMYLMYIPSLSGVPPVIRRSSVSMLKGLLSSGPALIHVSHAPDASDGPIVR